jgi:hypothetical protein
LKFQGEDVLKQVDQCSFVGQILLTIQQKGSTAHTACFVKVRMLKY